MKVQMNSLNLCSQFTRRKTKKKERNNIIFNLDCKLIYVIKNLRNRGNAYLLYMFTQ